MLHIKIEQKEKPVFNEDAYTSECPLCPMSFGTLPSEVMTKDMMRSHLWRDHRVKAEYLVFWIPEEGNNMDYNDFLESIGESG